MKHVKYLYFSALAVITAILVFLVVAGIDRKPRGIMKPSQFSEPHEIGAAIYRRFYQEMHQNVAVVFGINEASGFQKEVVEGLLRAAATLDGRFDLIIKDPQLPELQDVPIADRLILSVADNADRVAQVLGSYEQSRVLIYTTAANSSHLLDGNAVHKLEEKVQRPLFAVSLAGLALKEEEESDLQPACVEGSKESLAPLGCASLRYGRTYYRKKIKPAKAFVASMEQVGLSDYLLYVRRLREPEAP